MKSSHEEYHFDTNLKRLFLRFNGQKVECFYYTQPRRRPRRSSEKQNLWDLRQRSGRVGLIRTYFDTTFKDTIKHHNLNIFCLTRPKQPYTKEYVWIVTQPVIGADMEAPLDLIPGMLGVHFETKKV